MLPGPLSGRPVEPAPVLGEEPGHLGEGGEGGAGRGEQGVEGEQHPRDGAAQRPLRQEDQSSPGELGVKLFGRRTFFRPSSRFEWPAGGEYVRMVDLGVEGQLGGAPGVVAGEGEGEVEATTSVWGPWGAG